MKAFVSLHTAAPASQGDHEVSYAGYARQEIDYTDDFGQVSVVVEFPKPSEDTDIAVTHVCIGFSPDENLEALNVIDVVPNIPIEEGLSPRVVFANLPEPLPEDLHPIARAAWHLVNDRLLDPASLHHTLFEAINEELDRCRVPVFKITRSGAARFKAKMSMMRGLSSNL